MAIKNVTCNLGLSITFILILCTSAFAIPVTNAKPFLSPEVSQQHIENHLSAFQEDHNNLNLDYPDQVRSMYQKFNYRTIWFHHYDITDAGRTLIQAIKESAADQSSDYPYHVDEILYQLQTMQTVPSAVTGVDLLLTDAFIGYASDALSGKLVPNQNEPDHPAILKTSSRTQEQPINAHNQIKLDTVTTLENKLAPESLLPLIQNELTPRHQGYLKLRKALNNYFNIAQAGSWETLTLGKDLKMGDSDPQISKLELRLSLLGDDFNHKFKRVQTRNFLESASRDFNTPLNHPTNSPNTQQNYFDLSLSDSLKHFQTRHGLPPNGVLDDETRKRLNITPDQRIKQIAINMKRWRYLPEQLGDRYVMANMANYNLEVVDHGKTTLEMDIIIGRESRRTPILVQNLRTLVLNPSWSVPPRIAKEKYLPKARKNPNYLNTQNIEVVRGFGSKRKVIDPFDLDWDTLNLKKFPYRLEQKPGRKNSLGEVKFPLNNDFAIYLHDTASPKLFNRSMRALSSGCVRVEKPRQLTEELLKYNPGWDGKRIARAHRNKKTMYVGLKQETPVYLMYWTVWVDKHGTVQFRDDVYQRDTLTPDHKTITM